MTTTAVAMPHAIAARDDDLPAWRLHVLRATYLLIAVGMGSMMLPTIVNHAITDRGVIACLLGAMCLLDLLGVAFPRRMLPLLLFEFVWKLMWTLAYGLPQWLSGQQPPTFADDFGPIVFGVILMPLVIPWGHVWRHYLRAPAERWR